MARPAKNILHLEPFGDGWRLHGYVLGKHVRKRSKDFTALEVEKLELEQQLAQASQSEALQTRVRTTWLSEDQLRDAEAATRLAHGRRLVECVKVAERYMPPVGGTKCNEALAEWLALGRKRKRSDRTEDKNKRRVEAFLAYDKSTNLEDIRPLSIENWIFRADRADYTKMTDAQVLQAWLNFCVKRRYLLVSPFEVDMKDLSATARTKEPARILSADDCHALLKAAREVSKGRMLPYTILATWCFMSPQEIIRTTRAKMKLDGATPIIEVDTVKRRTAKFRTVTVPANVLPLLREAVKDWKPERCVELARVPWDRVRERAGLMQRAKVKHGRRRHLESKWQGSILRHTGISYLYQSLTAKATAGEFNEKSVIAEVCRQAGNTSDTSFRHYLNLPAEGAAAKFYGPVA